MKKLLFLILILQNLNANAQTDTSQFEIQRLKYETENLRSQIELVKRDQLNYQIEKSLIQDTYSNNYDKVNLFITGILLVFGFFGVFGLRDVNTIKKEHKEELEKLKSLQVDLEAKSKDFEQSKARYDSDITEILKQNDEQNKKLKILEIKDKIDKFFKDRDHQKALEFCAIALEFAPLDCDLLFKRSMLYARMNKYSDAIVTLKKLLEIEPDNTNATVNLAEIYLFSGQKDKFDEIYDRHGNLFGSMGHSKLKEYFNLIDLFNKSKFEEIEKYISSNIDRSDLQSRKSHIDGWDLYDALVFLSNKPESTSRTLLQNYTWYLDGKVSAQQVIGLLTKKTKNIPREQTIDLAKSPVKSK